jgi:hypothetical protein
MRLFVGACAGHPRACAAVYTYYDILKHNRRQANSASTRAAGDPSPDQLSNFANEMKDPPARKEIAA